jgi:hypothetical protein
MSSAKNKLDQNSNPFVNQTQWSQRGETLTVFVEKVIGHQAKKVNLNRRVKVAQKEQVWQQFKRMTIILLLLKLQVSTFMIFFFLNQQIFLPNLVTSQLDSWIALWSAKVVTTCKDMSNCNATMTHWPVKLLPFYTFNWMTYQIQVDGGECVKVRKTGKLADRPCSSLHPPICEYDCNLGYF